MTPNQAVIIAALIGAGCSMFSAAVGGYVLWSIDQIMSGLRRELDGHEARIRDLEHEQKELTHRTA